MPPPPLHASALQSAVITGGSRTQSYVRCQVPAPGPAPTPQSSAAMLIDGHPTVLGNEEPAPPPGLIPTAPVAEAPYTSSLHCQSGPPRIRVRSASRLTWSTATVPAKPRFFIPSMALCTTNLTPERTTARRRRARCRTRIHRARQHAHQPSETLATDTLSRRLTPTVPRCVGTDDGGAAAPPRSPSATALASARANRMPTAPVPNCPHADRPRSPVTYLHQPTWL